MAIPLRPKLPDFLDPAQQVAQIPPAAPALPPVAPRVVGDGSYVGVAAGVPTAFDGNKGRGFSAGDLEASYARQVARQAARKQQGWPNWLNRILNPNPAAPGAGLLPTLPPGQGFPLLSSLLSGNSDFNELMRRGTDASSAGGGGMAASAGPSAASASPAAPSMSYAAFWKSLQG